MADEWFVSIDIGSSKIAVVIAEEKADKLYVKGYATNKSSGVDKGLITNTDKVSKVIKKTIKEVGQKCDINPTNANVVVNISDNNLSTINHASRIKVRGSVSQKDVDSAKEASSVVVVPAINEILHSIVNNFETDDGLITAQPIGIKSQTLTASMHMVSVSKHSIDKVRESISKSELGATEIVLDSLAVSEAYIADEEKESGVCLIDIGAGVSNFSIFKDGGIVYSGIVNSGGEEVTKDIANAFNIPFDIAEELKKEHGRAQIKLPMEDKLIKFSKKNNSQENYLSSFDLIEVIEKSYLNLFSLIKRDINNIRIDKKKKKYRLDKGFVLTGGGSKIADCAELFFKSSRTKTKLAQVNENKITGNVSMISNPIYATSLGLLLYEEDESYAEVGQSSINQGFLGKIRSIKEKF